MLCGGCLTDSRATCQILATTTAELNAVKSTSEVAKAEFDRDISELTSTVNHMEEAAAERESMMAKNAQDALQRSIESARCAQSTTLPCTVWKKRNHSIR